MPDDTHETNSMDTAGSRETPVSVRSMQRQSSKPNTPFPMYGAMRTLAIRSSAELVRFAVDSGMLDRRPHAGAA